MSATPFHPDDKALLATAILLVLTTAGLYWIEGPAAFIASLVTGVVSFGFGGLAALGGNGRAYRLIGAGVMLAAVALLWPLLRAIASMH